VLFRPNAAIRGANTPANIQYVLKSPAQNVRVEILDAKGQVIRFYPDTANAGNAGRGGGGGRGGFGGNAGPGKAAGMNTFAWDLRYAPAVSLPNMILWGGSTTGPEVAPGKYTVRLTADGKTVSQPLVVKRHPFHAATDADLKAQETLALQIRDKVSEANSSVIQIRDIKKQITDRLAKSQDAQLKAAGDRLEKNLSAVEGEIYQVKNQAGQDPLNYPIKVNNRLASLLGVVTRADMRPIGNAQPIFNDLKAELKVQTDRLQQVLRTDLPAFNTEAKRLGLEQITVSKPVVF
jgi:hypothetical protein